MAAVEPVESLYRRAYDRHWPDIFRFLLAWTNDWAAAEDLTQETYLRLWRGRSSLDWERPILPWLLVAARRLATDRFRVLRRRVSPFRAEPYEEEAARTRWLDVRAALADLTPLERTALLMTTIEGWSYSELAETLNTSDGALRAAVSRARDKLEVAR